MAEHAHCSFDILKTISGWYQVVCSTHNMVVGPSFSTRREAESKMSQLYNEMWGIAEPVGQAREVVPVHDMHDASKGLPPDKPGVDTHSDKKSTEG